MRQAVILAGGAGTRLQARLKGLPKPMVSIAGKPLLEHQVELARSHGFDEIIMLVSHRAEAIIDHFGTGKDWDISISYLEDFIPRGTAGAILDAFDVLSDRFMVLYGDTMLNVDLSRFWNAHHTHHADATLFLHPNDHPVDSDLVEIDADERITRFHPYPHDSNRYYPNLVNAALYVIERRPLEQYKTLTGVIDFGKHLFPQMLHDGASLYGYRSPEYIKDAGTPERLDRVESDIRSGIVELSSLAVAAPAVFLDRDGTLNKEVNRVSSVSELHLLEDVAEPLRRLNQSYYRTAIVTNQPVIARGDCTESELQAIHNKLETLLGRNGAYVDAIYYCPHHPDSGYKGERTELKIACSCRKPAPGMILKAVDDLNIDLTKSWLIGDSTADLATARNAGLKSILVRTGHAGTDCRYPVHPDFEFLDLSAAVDFILDDYPRLFEYAQQIITDIDMGGRVVIAGLAKTGKSTLASILKAAIVDIGHNCVVISLDDFLKSADARKKGSVMQRYDVPAIKRFVSDLSKCNSPTEYSMPHYDRYKRKRYENASSVTICESDVIIFEGVIGLLVTELANCASHRIFVEVSEHFRRQNFWNEYRHRGLADDEIEMLFAERELDETPAVMASKEAANLIVADLYQ